jgi:general secretion pathway protein D
MRTRSRILIASCRCARLAPIASALMLAVFAAATQAQSTATTPDPLQASQAQTPQPATVTGTDAAHPRERDRRRAAKLYLAANKLFMDEHFEEALKNYNEATQLDPGNNNYRLAGEVARNHAVTALVQTAAKDRLRGDAAGARTSLERALALDPNNVEATQHMYELGEDAARQLPSAVNLQQAPNLGGPVMLLPSPGRHSFHIRSSQRQLLEQVFKAYGIDVMLDDSVHSEMAVFNIDDASFDSAVQAAGLVTRTFYVPLDAHRVVIAADTTTNRQMFTRQVLETIYLPGLKDEERTAIQNLATQVFNLRKPDVDNAAGAIVVRGPKDTLEAFNSTLRSLMDGHNQVLLDVRLIQVAHNSAQNLGIQLPQSFTAFNVTAELESILSQNQALVQQIISSGLAAPGDTLAILGILLASGQVSNPLFNGGVAVFGGGLTLTGLTLSPVSAQFNLTSSESRELDSMQLRLGDGETGTLKLGERYPIQTSSYSNLSPTIPNIPGLTGAGNSSSLTSILSALQTSVPMVPQVQYQDLGMVLKATANAMRDERVALNVDLQITALSGSTINGNPVLDNRAYSGVVTIKEGTAVVVVSDLDKSESRAISGTPGLSEIPGMNNVSLKNTQKSFASLLIIMTPHVVRYTQPGGHTPMLRIAKASQ